MDKERGFFMHRDFYTRLINREHPLPESFVPEHIVLSGGNRNFLQEALLWQSQEQVSIRADLLWTFPVLPSIWNSPKSFPKPVKAGG